MFNLEKAQWDLMNAYKHLMGDSKEDGDRLFEVISHP